MTSEEFSFEKDERICECPHLSQMEAITLALAFVHNTLGP